MYQRTRVHCAIQLIGSKLSSKRNEYLSLKINSSDLDQQNTLTMSLSHGHDKKVLGPQKCQSNQNAFLR